MMSPAATKLLCNTMAAEIVNRLRMSNETWDSYHGVPHRFSDYDYDQAAKEVSAVLYRHTAYGEEAK